MAALLRLRSLSILFGAVAHRKMLCCFAYNGCFATKHLRLEETQTRASRERFFQPVDGFA
jgi:hypothetical protein